MPIDQTLHSGCIIFNFDYFVWVDFKNSVSATTSGLKLAVLELESSFKLQDLLPCLEILLENALIVNLPSLLLIEI